MNKHNNWKLCPTFGFIPKLKIRQVINEYLCRFMTFTFGDAILSLKQSSSPSISSIKRLYWIHGGANFVALRTPSQGAIGAGACVLKK
jgi:hypothetical protein